MHRHRKLPVGAELLSDTTNTDELFLILDGELDMEFRYRTVTLQAGDLIVVP